MNFKTLNARHIGLISLYWSRYIVRSGAGLVYLLIALIFGLSVAQIIIMPVEQLMNTQRRQMGQVDPEAVRGRIISTGQPITQFVLGIRSMQEIVKQSAPDYGGPPMRGSPRADRGSLDPWTSFLMKDRPALLSAIFLVLVFGMPFAIPFLAFNQVTGDIQHHGLRYLLLRTERGNIYFGRFLGTTAFSTAVMALIVAIITLYLGLKVRIYPAGALTLWAVHGFLVLSLLMVPYIAMCSIVSVSVDSPFFSLVLANLIISGVLLFAVVGGLKWQVVKLVKYLLPWGWQNYLLHPSPSLLLAAVAACFLYTAVFLILGYARFETRDL
jgi:ABC-type transport system involved in multi-copper enzyme maturation permease subunit